jgi:hypothetical protein
MYRVRLSLFNILIFLEVWEWARAFGRMGVQHPHFLKLCPIHLEVLNVPFLMEIGDFTFFSKFRIRLDLHIYYWDFYFMKN